jgi:hypothetical protein
MRELVVIKATIENLEGMGVELFLSTTLTLIQYKTKHLPEDMSQEGKKARFYLYY